MTEYRSDTHTRMLYDNPFRCFVKPQFIEKLARILKYDLSRLFFLYMPAAHAIGLFHFRSPLQKILL